MTTLNVFSSPEGVRLSFGTLGGDEVSVVMQWPIVAAFATRLLDMTGAAFPDERVGRTATGPDGQRGVIRAVLPAGTLGIVARSVLVVEIPAGLLVCDSKGWAVDDGG